MTLDLDEMERLLDIPGGPVWWKNANCRALLAEVRRLRAAPAAPLDMKPALDRAYALGLLVGLCERIWDRLPAGHEVRGLLDQHFGTIGGPPFS